MVKALAIILQEFIKDIMNLTIEMDMEDIKDRNQLTKVNIKIIKEMVLVVFGQMEITIKAILNKI